MAKQTLKQRAPVSDAEALAEARRDPRVAEAWSEGEDGLWVSLKPGYAGEPETHSLHEESGERLVAALGSIGPCDCRECKPDAVA